MVSKKIVVPVFVVSAVILFGSFVTFVMAFDYMGEAEDKLAEAEVLLAKEYQADEKLKQAEAKWERADVTLERADKKLKEANAKLSEAKKLELAPQKLADTERKLAEANKKLKQAEEAGAFRTTCTEKLYDLQIHGFAVTGLGMLSATEPSTQDEVGQLITKFSKKTQSIDIDKCTITPADKRVFELWEIAKDTTLDMLQGTAKRTTSTSCVLFCDSTGYEPAWAKSMGQMQASSKCMAIDDYGSRDSDWCLEFSGYMLDAFLN